MATDVMMPRLSDSMEEGTVLEWLVDGGGEVKRGEPLVEIETDKANMTYEADTDGVLIEVLAQEGETLPIGQAIARIGAAGEEATGQRPEATGDGAQAEEAPAQEAEEHEPEAEPAREPDRAPAPATRHPPPATSAGDGNGRVKASPVARRMAREMGLELAGIQGSGPGGRIVKADIEAAARGGEAQVDEAEEEQAAPAEAPEKEPEREEEVPAPIASGDGQTGKGEVSH